MKSGLVLAALLSVHLVLAALHATHFLPADSRWFQAGFRREEWRDALAQRHVARVRRDLRRWTESPDPQAGAYTLARSLDDAYYGVAGWRLPQATRDRWDRAYAALSASLAAVGRSRDDDELATAHRACRQVDEALEELGAWLTR